MAFKESYVPYGGYWSTPFCRWQGSFANQHAIKFGAQMAQKFMESREISPKEFDSVILGNTVPQLSSFYGGPWIAGLLGAGHATGPVIGQACATSAKCVEYASQGIETGTNRSVLVLCADRCSNGPHLTYPNPNAPGATVSAENWVMDNFGTDPFAKNAMIQTAENVAKEEGIAKEEQDKMTLLRHQQYQDALANDREFQKKYMLGPVEVMDAKGRKVVATVDGDEGVFPTTEEGLSKLRPVLPEGTVSFGSQTHPADGNTGMIVTNRENAKKLGTRQDVEVQIMSFGEGRVKKGYMAKAIVPAAKMALEQAGLEMADIVTTKTHTPFAVNDVYFCREMDIDWKKQNNYGTSLIYGHPQGPTGSRLMMELIEELVLLGGGYGLFDGCAAGDTGAALVFNVKVD